ncbi:hypothetical protein AAX26_00275 [Aliarcobacter thereius]|uniref:Uncharacterized protein n=2 Tax=Aliarcobacter thereius TaxID=544718 RepID=A0A1C0B9K4_9BACT|nr:hypothetical protein [Aliarcobacter thereius]OCL88589.1 hypothetical protein AAX26_00275 [Aliarcobacter thereius]OCL92083.1 hypothetical protein AAX25_00813 [Aliarcobacter thereius]OCL94821.1 hypothetical protein AA347_00260 [Aliarcobacter thereius LMG 24486]OCM00268.1 hypothetical protein AAX29_00266 [Aliarcobacter thereius]QBF15304.1 hypothetical protein ATH_0214 [Aliarcobacter thereius LMG 24486]
MIIAIKRKRKTKLLIKKIIFFALFFAIIFIGYSSYEKFNLKQEQIRVEAELEIERNLEKKQLEKEQLEIHTIILAETQRVVELIDQKNVEDIRIFKNKVVYILKPNTNISAIEIRYGAHALVKRSFKEIVVVVDLENILKGKLE